MTGVSFFGAADTNAAWDGTRLYRDADYEPGAAASQGLRGAAASVRGAPATGWRIVRDPLGLNKLFWARDDRGDYRFAARPKRLVDTGARFEDIVSVPPGTVLDLATRDASPTQCSLVPSTWYAADGPERGVEAIGTGIRTAMMRYLEAALVELRPKNVYVCLSGGLDSSGIAAMTRELVSSAVAVSFDLKQVGRPPSDDRVAAARVARDLGLPLLDVSVTPDELLDHLDTVLVEGVDWRDFNVHAALVNAALAFGIAGSGADESSVVLTGDLANEFLVDYHAESYRGQTYYRLPRLRPRALRSSLVRGLDTCNREIGIFEAYELAVVQPYAVAVDDYLALPEAFLTGDERKSALDRVIFGSLVPEYVYQRKKVRAQVGSDEVGGVLGTCLDRGIDQDWLRRRFAALHDVDDDAALDRFMRAGRYRTAIPGNPTSTQEH
jgi:asparagine synthetase B (glutamine-hydrolysing)